MKNYSRTNWVDNVTPVNACNLNKIETALMRLASGKLEAGDIIEGDGIKIDVAEGKLIISMLGTPEAPYNYNDLDNLPSINRVELRGNLTLKDLGITNLLSNDQFESIMSLIDYFSNSDIEIIETNEEGFFIVDDHYNIGISISQDGSFDTGKLSENLMNQIKNEIKIWE